MTGDSTVPDLVEAVEAVEAAKARRRGLRSIQARLAGSHAGETQLPASTAEEVR